MHDVAEFLSSHEPFRELDEAALEDLAQRVEVEFFAAGATILAQGGRSQDRIRVVRRGTVELVDGDRVLDLLGEGEMFGHPSMLSGLPTGFEVRAAEDALCYAIAADDVLPLLARPEGLRFLGRSTLSRPRPLAAGGVVDAFDFANQPVATLVGEQPVIAEPGLAVGEAVRRMESEGASSVLVKLIDGGFGIVTDRDLRSNVIATGRQADVPVAEVMTAPAHCVGPEQTGAELMLVMLDHGIRHVPVVSGRSTVVGVVRDLDLLAAQTRTPFMLRRAIAYAGDGAELGRIVEQLNRTVVSLHQAGLAYRQISAVISVVSDALIRRMIEIAVQDLGPAPTEFAWLALGSDGRREAVPSSDVDSGMAWRDESERDPEETRSYMHALADQVGESLKFTGWRLDAHGVTASGDFSCSSISDWRRAIATWLSHPDDNKVLIATSIMLDGRAVFGPEKLNPNREFYKADNKATLERWMLRLALAAKPPTGFLRDIVVEHSGEHRGTLDVKHGGLLPVVDIARYAGLKAGVQVTSTVERLRAAGQSGALEEGHARTLEEAFDLFMALRVEHQVRQLERGEEPDDHLNPKDLTPLTRRYLRDAFREVTAVQKSLGGGLRLGAGVIA
jgi:CBS domain-containing protein